MKNMGLSRLRLVGADFGDGSGELLARTVHAQDIWGAAEFFDTLEAALEVCSVSAGTTRRRGRRRKNTTLRPGELAAFLKGRKGGRAALVFGNERTGLDDRELALCTMASHIPVSPDFPSLNLSHAVQIYAYELYLTLGSGGEVPGQWAPMAGSEIEALVHRISASLESIGFYKHPGREDQERFLRDLISRAGLSLSEGRYLGNIIAKAWRLGTKQ
jgi:tRNA/rRNA methyltransferase/tRNA (cytidine32/uridine32-2'-O)-methyltransferase